MQSIEKWQIKTIYTLANGLGLVHKDSEMDALHEMVYSISQKAHVSDLSKDEANLIISRLKGNMKGKFEKVPGTDGMVSQGQERKMWALLYELKKYDSPEVKGVPLQKRLKGFLKKYAGVDDLKFLNYKKANQVIEGLKGLVTREKAKAGK